MELLGPCSLNTSLKTSELIHRMQSALTQQKYMSKISGLMSG